ncbi:MAG: ATP-binding cassette domain-containing protein [Gemmatimonadota bacterium]
MNSVASLEVIGLRKVFPARGRRNEVEVVAVDDVSFTIAPGESLAIVGESGSGKTTTARMILGLEKPTSGRVVVGGRERTAERQSSRERRRRARETQLVFQDPYLSLNPRQKVGTCLREVLRLHFDLTHEQEEARVNELLDLVGLGERHGSVLPRSLSGGERQRVAIARALAAEPDILVLDEAVSALDVSVQAQILNLLIDLRMATGVSYLFISHDLAVVRYVSDSVLVMENGRAVETGPAHQVLQSPSHPYTRALLAVVPRPGWRDGAAAA